MNHIVSVTFIPDRGTNVVLDKEPFLEDFIDKSEEVLDLQPVGSSIEVVYDHVKTDFNGSFMKVVSMRCVIRQKQRGVFIKTLETIQPEFTPHVQTVYGRYRRLKHQFLKSHK